MAARRQRGPRVPFVFRIYSDDGNGIMYHAVEQLDEDTYNCFGTRRIGTSSDGYTIWLFGGYMDAMPTASIHEIVHPRRLRNPEKNELIEGAGLDDYLYDYDAFCDDTSYWFMEKRGRSRSRSRSSNSNGATKSKSKSKSKSKGKSRKAAGGGGSSGGW